MRRQLTAKAAKKPLFDLRLENLDQPLLAVALHHGTDLRPEVAVALALDAEQRRRGEDLFSGTWASISPNRIVVLRSRFEVDLDRPAERAVYVTSEDPSGASIWRDPPPPPLLARSLAEHVLFYETVRGVLERIIARHGRVLVLDLHSYNHRPNGPLAPPADPSLNPDLDLGTGTVDRRRWGAIVDAFRDAAQSCRLDGHYPDVRENVRSRGGYFPAWVHRTFPEHACVLALEVKKTFMDEWTGRVDLGGLWAWREVLRAGAQASLRVMGGS